jgi:hypothetical protein
MNAIKTILEKECKKRKLKLHYIDDAIAYRSEDLIFINKNLVSDKRFEKYAVEVIYHELRHTGRFSSKDFWMDMFEGDLMENLKFGFKYPKSLWHFWPVSKFNGVSYVDANQIIQYVIILITIFLLGAWIS